MITILIDQIFFCFAFLSITYFLRNIFLLYINIVLSSDIKTNVGVLNFLREDIKNK